MRSRQLYASVTATIAGTVYFDIPENTTIRAIAWALQPTPAADGDLVSAEISLNSNQQTTQNDAQGIISILSAGYKFTTSGLGYAQINYTAPVNCPVKAGQRIYLNVSESGTGTWYFRVLVWFD